MSPSADHGSSSWREISAMRTILGIPLRYPKQHIHVAFCALAQQFRLHSVRFKHERDIPDQRGKVVLVTGGMTRSPLLF